MNVRSRSEIDHKMWILSFWRAFLKASLASATRHFYNSGYLGLATSTLITAQEKSVSKRSLAFETTFRLNKTEPAYI
jgi:hypothetical protein